MPSTAASSGCEGAGREPMSPVEKAFATGLSRELSPAWDRFVTVYGALIAVGVVAASILGKPGLYVLTAIFLGAMLVLVFVTIGTSVETAEKRVPLYDLGLAALSVACGIYFGLNADYVSNRISLLDLLTPSDVFFGASFLLLTLEASRRTTGIGLTGFVVLILLYNLFGDGLPGALGHGPIDHQHFLDLMVFTTEGIFGAPLRVAATFAFLFVLFGALLNATGAGAFFFNLAAAFTGRAPGGPAKIGVVSSGLFGTISGNPVADVVTTGSVTIPMMKKLGYPAALAGGIEVAASTGGSLAPPVLGAAAFIMAEFTGIPYAEIAIAATIPALLYYVSIYAQVHLRALSLGLRGLDSGDIPTVGDSLLKGWFFLFPIAVLCVGIVLELSATLTALISIAACLITTPFAGQGILPLRLVFEALGETARRMAAVTGACAAAGLVVGALTMTGLATKFGHLVLLLTASDLFLSLVVTAVITILFGLGLPTSASYILTAVLVAPVLTKLGLSLLAAHMFILYYAVLSNVTPPVAVAAYAASAIAQANPLYVALSACRLCLVAFIVPFSFAYGEALLLEGSWTSILLSTLTATLGVLLLAAAVEGHYRRPLERPARLLLFLAGLAFFVPHYYGPLGGMGLAGLAWCVSPGLRAGLRLRFAGDT